MRAKRSALWRAVAVELVAATPVLAATGGGERGIGLWTVAFLAFGALIVLFQAVPALVLLGAAIRGLFAPVERGAEGAGKARETA